MILLSKGCSRGLELEYTTLSYAACGEFCQLSMADDGTILSLPHHIHFAVTLNSFSAFHSSYYGCHSFV